MLLLLRQQQIERDTCWHFGLEMHPKKRQQEKAGEVQSFVRHHLFTVELMIVGRSAAAGIVLY